MFCNPDIDPGCSFLTGATDTGIVAMGFTLPGIGTAGVGAGAVISDKRLKLLELPATVAPVVDCACFNEAGDESTESFTCSNCGCCC